MIKFSIDSCPVADRTADAIRVGVADAGLSSVEAAAGSTDLTDVWAVHTISGGLIAPSPDDIIGDPRAVRGLGQFGSGIFCFTIYANGTMCVKMVSTDCGIWFCNLPPVVKPILEMCSRDCEVSIVSE